MRRSTADARAQDAKERYLAEAAEAQKSLQARTEGAEERAEVNEEQAVAAETVEAQQQQEERSTAEAAQAPVQQGRSTIEQQQQDDAAALRNLAAEPHAAVTRPGKGEPIAELAQQIKAVASSAMQKMHGIRAHASMWWNKRRRSSTENANHVEEAASNDGGQRKEEIGPLKAPAPREDQLAESSMTAAAEEKGEARTHNSGGSTHAKEAFTAQLTMNCIGSSAYTKVVSRAQGKNHWSFGGRSWKPRARDCSRHRRGASRRRTSRWESDNVYLTIYLPSDAQARADAHTDRCGLRLNERTRGRRGGRRRERRRRS